jgi:hypothetical protein
MAAQEPSKLLVRVRLPSPASSSDPLCRLSPSAAGAAGSERVATTPGLRAGALPHGAVRFLLGMSGSDPKMAYVRPTVT